MMHIIAAKICQQELVTLQRVKAMLPTVFDLLYTSRLYFESNNIRNA